MTILGSRYSKKGSPPAASTAPIRADSTGSPMLGYGSFSRNRYESDSPGTSTPSQRAHAQQRVGRLVAELLDQLLQRPLALAEDRQALLGQGRRDPLVDQVAAQLGGEQAQRPAPEEGDEPPHQLGHGLGEGPLQGAVARGGQVVGQEQQGLVVIVKLVGQFAGDECPGRHGVRDAGGLKADAAQEEVEPLAEDSKGRRGQHGGVEPRPDAVPQDRPDVDRYAAEGDRRLGGGTLGRRLGLAQLDHVDEAARLGERPEPAEGRVHLGQVAAQGPRQPGKPSLPPPGAVVAVVGGGGRLLDDPAQRVLEPPEPLGQRLGGGPQRRAARLGQVTPGDREPHAVPLQVGLRDHGPAGDVVPQPLGQAVEGGLGVVHGPDQVGQGRVLGVESQRAAACSG